MTNRDERLVCSTTIAGFPLQLTTVSMDPLDTGNERIHIEIRVECADSATA